MSLFSTKPFIFQRHFISTLTRALKRNGNFNGYNNYMKKFQGSFLKNSTRFSSTKTTENAAKQEKGLKALMQKYGYSALFVYLSISVIDLPLSFLLVHSVGEVKIKLYINRAKQLFGHGNPNQEEYLKELEESIVKREEDVRSGKHDEKSYWERVKQSTLLTEFIIAYGIHKLLIVVRVPLTAALTPMTVRVLNKHGIKLGSNSKDFFKSISENTKVGHKSSDPKAQDFVKNGAAVPRQKQTAGRKWFNGLM
ncbi:hypothetical protein TPHA_0K01760 [Tetrapisispora phaffii CBS 4417]|uniref:DUF1279 domain-containing protein n=1 Tax=Tetrapisispora phaffii (strain ATCC 24235 / CBS 4417 / NBRC 1672 / NRRL Y-8282 / UCD 70-5) TaxID=1071381 RepID=G8BZI1_TETPH|nr:hypothetical protein TPHA_0K01760 [Tetrapisispora phaffii CBS 4417]CCE65309.1 hypothetical protein TPHA_0K01760 [Tetrapisispora phaffii CBS 4417]